MAPSTTETTNQKHFHGDKTMNDPRLIPNANWQTPQRGTNEAEYAIYRDCADNGHGIDFTTGKPLKTFDEWLAS
jgi:hypothetical protein